MKAVAQSLALVAVLAVGIAWPHLADAIRRWRILREPLRVLRENARREAREYHRRSTT